MYDLVYNQDKALEETVQSSQILLFQSLYLSVHTVVS